MNEENKWHGLWEARGEKIEEFDPVKLDGFDSGTGILTPESLEIVVNKIKDRMLLDSSDDFLEVGCGAGMLLMPLSRFVKTASGVDYSSSLIRKLESNWGKGTLQVAEARSLPFEKDSFDKVLAHSIFQYLPSYGCALESIQEMMRVCRKPGIIYIGDIPDMDKKEENNILRRKIDSAKADNPELQHRFYHKDFFREMCKGRGLKYEIFDQDIKGYENSRFRFNVVIGK